MVHEALYLPEYNNIVTWGAYKRVIPILWGTTVLEVCIPVANYWQCDNRHRVGLVKGALVYYSTFQVGCLREIGQ